MIDARRVINLLASSFALIMIGSATGAAAPDASGSSQPREGVGHCEGIEREASLRADQDRLLARLGGLTTLRGPDDLAALAAVGHWMLPTHLHVNFRNLGFAIARPEAIFEKQFYSGNPGMLLYQSLATTPIEEHVDPYRMNFPYALVGWAHGVMYTPGDYPTSPDLCVSQSDWFVHEQGVHTLADWGFTAEPPAEAFLGERTGELFPLPTRAFGATHGRFWDIHVWMDPAGGPPVISVLRPFGHIHGAAEPPDAFFYPGADSYVAEDPMEHEN